MMTPDDQYAEADRMKLNYEADREFRIRELAEGLNKMDPNDPRDLYVPMTFTSMQYTAPIAPTVQYSDIRVGLVPGLMGTKEGQLIAEIMLRDAMDCARLGILD